MLLIYFSFTTKCLQEQNPEPYLIKLYATGKELHANTVGNILQKASISYTHFAIFHLKGKLSWFALKSWFPMPSANDNSLALHHGHCYDRNMHTGFFKPCRV